MSAGTIGWPQPRIGVRTFPKISVITPSLNQAAFLESTIQSILCQGYPNLEYIIIDGGSTDGSVEIIRKYEKHLARWLSEPDGGMYAGIVKGISSATGDVIAWLNSDDLYFPWALSLVASIMESLPQVEWISTLLPCLWNDESLLYQLDRVAGFSRDAFAEGRYLPGSSSLGWIQQESTFWRRSLQDKIDCGRLAGWKLAGEFGLWSLFFEHAELYGVPYPLGGFRMQKLQKTQTGMGLYVEESRQVLSGMRKRGFRVDGLVRGILSKSRMSGIPLLGGAATAGVGYVGRRIVRDLSQDERSWRVESYRFV